jgi:hypothetical protein
MIETDDEWREEKDEEHFHLVSLRFEISDFRTWLRRWQSPNCREQRKPAQLKVARVLELVGQLFKNAYQLGPLRG